MNLWAIDRSFSRLLSALDAGLSDAARLTLVSGFLERLPADAALIDAFAPELVERLGSIDENARVEGLDPDAAARVARLLEPFGLAGEPIRRLGARQYAVVGAFRDMLAVVVLDPRVMEGHAPTSDTYVPERSQPGTERWYVILLRSEAGDLFRYLVRRTFVRHLVPHPSSTQVHVVESGTQQYVTEARQTTDARLDSLIRAQLLPYSGFASVMTDFDRAMWPIAIETSDVHDSLTEVLIDAGYLSRSFDEGPADEYLREALFWDGDGWVAGKPVENRFYREALKAASGDAADGRRTALSED